MNKWAIFAGIVTLLGMSAVSADGDPQAGSEKAAVCAACHGADGNSINPEWP
ncbi:MAG: cytochrome c4, partial [Gammaproteobacteria bacterium]|nr:cytochrome c4 [Gammaproteobacteria bacterium]